VKNPTAEMWLYLRGTMCPQLDSGSLTKAPMFRMKPLMSHLVLEIPLQTLLAIPVVPDSSFLRAAQMFVTRRSPDAAEQKRR
jgi:hypothetical protein